MIGRVVGKVRKEQGCKILKEIRIIEETKGKMKNNEHWILGCELLVIDDEN